MTHDGTTWPCCSCCRGRDHTEGWHYTPCRRHHYPRQPQLPRLALMDELRTTNPAIYRALRDYAKEAHLWNPAPSMAHPAPPAAAPGPPYPAPTDPAQLPKANAAPATTAPTKTHTAPSEPATPTNPQPRPTKT